MKEYVEDTLMQFLQTRVEPFSIPDLLKFLGEPVNPNSIEELSGFLVFNQLAYLNPSFEDKKESWITRAGLFLGKTLVICPTKLEIASGVLIPGSHFVPFYNPGLLPHELSFHYNGKLLSRSPLECSMDEIYSHYQLFGDEYIPQYLSMDNDENALLFNATEYDDPARISVSVIDMREMYWSTQFKNGDRILARLEDWSNGVFDLVILRAEQRDAEKQAEWMKDFEECLIQSFEIVGSGASIDEQLAFAFFLGLDILFTPFAASLSDFFRWSDRVAIEPYGVESRLWFAGQTIPPQETWAMTLVAVPSSLTEEAFMHLSLPLSAHIMDSYVLDALFRKEENTKALMARMIPSRLKNAAVCNPVIERALQLRFKQLSESYNWFADHDAGDLRNRCLVLHNSLMRFILFLQQSGITPEQIPEQGAVIISQLMAHTIAALENIDFSAQEEPTDIDSLWISLEGMEESYFETKTLIQEMMPELIKKRFSVIKKMEPPDERY